MIKVIKEIRVGSSSFFAEMPGYVTRDIDVVLLLDKPLKKDGFAILHAPNLKGKDCFMMPPGDKETIINYHLETELPMQSIKFLSKELCDYLGFSLEDIKRLSPRFNEMDQGHGYASYIFECYVKNNKMELTDEQRETAYEIYKKERPETYHGA